MCVQAFRPDENIFYLRPANVPLIGLLQAVLLLPSFFFRQEEYFDY